MSAGVEPRAQRPLKWCAIIVAAGRGTRFGKPKQLIDIAGSPMISWSIRTFESLDEIVEIVVVTEREWLQDVAEVASSCIVVPGGATRQASTYEGLNAISASCDCVLVHDGARPMVTPQEVYSGMEPVRPGHGSVLAIPVVDTIKIVEPQLRVVSRTLDRGVLWAAQTPQFATLEDMRSAHEAGLREGVDATDDAMLLERAGVQVHVVPGSVENFKVTLPEDHVRADRTMRGRLAAEMGQR